MIPLTTRAQGALDTLGHIVDYHGMERSGHNAIMQWLLRLMPSTAATGIAACDTDTPIWQIPGRKVSGVLMYGADVRLSTVESRQEGKPMVVTSVRDIRNLVSSRWEWHKRHGNTLFWVEEDKWASIWTEYARQALGRVDYFDKSSVSIFYDKWATSPEYRSEMARKLTRFFGWDSLGYEAAEKIRHQMTQPGYGSSFEGAITESVDTIPVTERWKGYEDDPQYKAFFKAYPELLVLNRELLAMA